ncbi:MAG: inorganic phosphate transporter [Pseudomonadota bacterium]
MQTLQLSIYTLGFLLLLALVFNFLNGFHDAADAIATIVSTGVLRPRNAVILAAVCNVAAVLVFQLNVATSIVNDVVDPNAIDHIVIFGALCAAIIWNLITWYRGTPSSSSHALIGGLAGAAIAKAGTFAVLQAGLIKIIVFILLSPLFGFLFGALFMILVSWFFVRSTPRRVDQWFRRLQLISTSMYSLGHGGNDAQKTIGIISMLLLVSGYTSSGTALPSWVAFNCYAVIGIGTLLGGWRIVRTMGQRITKLRPVGGFCAESGGATMLFIATYLGIPVSTTHTITGAIVGVGSARKTSAVRWGIAGSIMWTWIATIPASAFLGGLAWWIGTLIFNLGP